MVQKFVVNQKKIQELLLEFLHIEKNEHDSKTPTLENTISNLGSKTINEVICDRGYREVNK